VTEAAATAIIPVRLGSQRLPRKALLAESGQPLFIHTCRQAQRAGVFSSVYVATDSDDVAAAARAADIAVLRTSTEPRTGSERCAEAVAAIDAEYIVDVQGDWPEVAPEDLERLVGALRAGHRCATLATVLRDQQHTLDPNVVKVVRAANGRALYFSRAVVPHAAPGAAVRRLRHIGVYGFDRQTLLDIPTLPSSGLAETESLEQLRFLENEISIEVLLTETQPWGIETQDDYRAFLQRQSQRQSDHS